MSYFQKILERYFKQNDSKLPVHLYDMTCLRCKKSIISVDYNIQGMVASLFGFIDDKYIDGYRCKNCKFTISKYQLWSIVHSKYPQLSDDCDILGIGLINNR